MSPEKNDPPNPSNDAHDRWEERQISLQDIVLSNSWAVQSILNYLEEKDPDARERIWYHYEKMKQQQEAARRQTESDSPPQADTNGNGEDA